jgi:hypothetical protein
MTWVNPGHLASRNEFCGKTGPEFFELHKTRNVPVEVGEIDLKLIQISNTVIRPHIKTKFPVTIKSANFDTQTASNPTYGQFITHPHTKLHTNSPIHPSDVTIRAKFERHF